MHDPSGLERNLWYVSVGLETWMIGKKIKWEIIKKQEWDVLSM